MMLAAVTADAKIFWYVALGIGLVVVAVVIILVSLLKSYVREIDEGVATLWQVTGATAQNTTGLYQLAGSASIIRALREEVMRHDKLLTERNGNGSGVAPWGAAR